MGTNYNQVDWYTSFTIVLAAGESRKINKLGKYVTILSNSNADDPRIQINGQQGGKIPSGLSLELPETEDFDRIELKNESASSMTLEVAISNGKIIDSRTVLSGSIEVKNDPLNTPLDTDDANTQAKLDSLIALLQNDEDLRSPLTPLGGSYVAATNTGAVQTLISPASNTGGLILRTVSMCCGSSSQSALFADTSAPSGYTDVTKEQILQCQSSDISNMKDVFVPAGKGIYWDASTNSTSNRVHITYDLL